MDDEIIRSLERLLHEKIMLYNDLLQCFEVEKESLLAIDLDKLWSISKEKDEICAKICALRHEIISLCNSRNVEEPFDLNEILALIPAEKRAPLQKLHLTLVKLRCEIEMLRKENTLFVDDSLRFLDEMISIITGEAGSRILYDDRCHLGRTSARITLSREA
jgi:flagellar biosynthesis/type III secretory pathway chaperone